MSNGIRYGLIVGAVSFFLTACAATVVGICGPVVPLIAGAVAGYLTVKKDMPATQSEGGKSGAISGAVAGAISMVGQIVGGVVALTILPRLQATADIYSGISSDPSYWLAGIGTGVCMGLVGVALAAGAGFGAGYLSTSPAKPADPTA